MNQETSLPIDLTQPSLVEWSYRGSDALNDPPGRVYRYREDRDGDRHLTVEIRYLTHTDGNIATYFQRYYNIQTTFNIKHQEKTGFYSLFSQDRTTYLSSCIDVHGNTTVTTEQFAHNRNTQDLEFRRILSWLLGQSDLRQWNCLWIILSLPLNSDIPGENYTNLERIWLELVANNYLSYE
ncbi:MAG: cyanoexosortase A system-associated protein [Roseofilum sp. SBFL]|uniref:cyanoexosortase A system-associated protein n=1 Tax=unclassified Roseofilum TaxID=2620099 RepID=UPI001B099BC9|nr:MULTISPECIES: cyanoexosortase A system-associated protein [unclassified Roseofilum]MBP0011602.1 cyanoexosortase A system-associated protein [Roseofilum sp. SID3]MBP0026662.1 cyanoexosortase A system-associated protein [Roseofilum sp. SID2]MBP0040093.1 cyanoexosortase A system-associated protein [Roseofilum sp. SID1]MBP0044032.1 cyanoexosortase A system-associated protein [Roseofilum sp. SBFL]